MAVAAISDETFAAPEPAIHVSRMRSSLRAGRGIATAPGGVLEPGSFGS
jgi:hypothetical protein